MRKALHPDSTEERRQQLKPRSRVIAHQLNGPDVSYWPSYPKHPRAIISGSPDSLVGCFWFETLPQPNKFTGGSKLMAYRRARNFALMHAKYRHSVAYLLFAGPKGILP